MHVLVAGATGTLGSEICRRLRARGHEVTGLVRESAPPDRLGALRDAGVALREGDLTAPDSLPHALAGADAVISTVTAIHQRTPEQSLDQVDGAGQRALIEAAATAGVKRFGYVSFSGNLGREDALTRGKRASEEALRASGLAHTILRPSFFMEVWLSPRLGFDHPNAHATLYGSGEQAISFISFRDVAEFAARTVDDPAAEGAILELGGPAALSPLEVVRIFEEESGRKFDVQQVPEATLDERYRNAEQPLPKAFAALMLSYAGGDAIAMAETAARYGVQLRSVRDYARDVVAQ
jgi:NADH dehydrogenase